MHYTHTHAVAADESEESALRSRQNISIYLFAAGIARVCVCVDLYVCEVVWSI